jgi:hypothetical protein
MLLEGLILTEVKEVEEVKETLSILWNSGFVTLSQDLVDLA